MIEALEIADPPEAWAAAGFSVDDDAVCRVGTVRLRLVGRERGTGIVGWSLRGVALRGVEPGTCEVDGIPTTVSGASQAQPASHPNGVTSLDHLVLLSPDLDRTKVALGDLGLEPRRERDGELGGAAIRQVFYRLGAVILEVVGSPGTSSGEPSSLWGITYVSEDIDASAAFFAEKASPVKEAVQPGRRITTVRHRDLGMSVRTALISPHVRG